MNNVLALSGIVIKELYRRKDFYVLFVLTAVMTLLLGSINFFNENAIVRYLKELCLLLIWMASLVIAITTTARQIPAERENRTIFPLLAKPVSRVEIIFGKFLGCWLATGIALAVFYFFFGLITSLREHHWPVLNLLQAGWLHWVMLAVVISMVLLGSLVFAAPSSNSTICFVVVLGILFLGRHLNQVALQLTQPAGSIIYGIYFLIPHLEFFDIRQFLTHGDHLIPWAPVALATLYGALYSLFFLLAAALVFRRKAMN